MNRNNLRSQSEIDIDSSLSHSSPEIQKNANSKGAVKRRKKKRSLSVNEVVKQNEKPRMSGSRSTNSKLTGLDTDPSRNKSDILVDTAQSRQDKGLLPRRKGTLQERKRSSSLQNLSALQFEQHGVKYQSFVDDLENVQIDPNLMIYFRLPPEVQELVGKYLSMKKNEFSLARKAATKEAWVGENSLPDDVAKTSCNKSISPRGSTATRPSLGSILQARSLVKKWVFRAGNRKQRLPPISDIDAGIALDLKTGCTPVFAQALKSLGYDARGEKMRGDFKTPKDFTPVSRIIMNLKENEKGVSREK